MLTLIFTSAELKELALQVSTDPDHKFDLSIQLDDLDTALALARASPHLGSQSKWRTVGDRALASWKISLAEECFKMANDWSALLLIYTSTGDIEGLRMLSEKSAAAGQNNIAFASSLQLSDPTKLVQLLLSTDRAPEAALFSRTFAPSQTPKAVKAWRKTLEAQKKTKLANGIADPDEHPEEFNEGWEAALERERTANQQSVEYAAEEVNGHHDDGEEVYEETSDDYSYQNGQQEVVNGVHGLSLQDDQEGFNGYQARE